MHPSAHIAACLMTLCALSSLDGADIYVFAGQSNMAGYEAYAYDLSTTLQQANPQVKAFVPTQGNPPSSGYWLPTSVGWENYAPYTARDINTEWWKYYNPGDWWVGKDRHGFGPELMVTRNVQASVGGTVYMVKYSVGATNLASNWNPNDTNPASLYNTMKAWVNMARTQLGGGTVKGFFWMQGESDAYDVNTANAYGANFTAFIGKVRTDFGDPNLPVVFGQISPNAPDPQYKSTVRQQQANVAASVARCAMVNTDDLALAGTANQIHFTAASEVTLGERMASAYLSMVAPAGTTGSPTGSSTGSPTGTSTGSSTGTSAGTTGAVIVPREGGSSKTSCGLGSGLAGLLVGLALACRCAFARSPRGATPVDA